MAVPASVLLPSRTPAKYRVACYPGASWVSIGGTTGELLCWAMCIDGFMFLICPGFN